MQEQTNDRNDAQAALAALEQAYAYYQPEPVLVHVNARELDEDKDGFAYYRAA